jgi:hypothetical protein
VSAAQPPGAQWPPADGDWGVIDWGAQAAREALAMLREAADGPGRPAARGGGGDQAPAMPRWKVAMSK